MSDKQYAERDIRDLEPHYIKHISAMTGEGLHSKADIAAELAYRDKEIESLRQQVAALESKYRWVLVRVETIAAWARKKPYRSLQELNERIDHAMKEKS